MTVFVPESIKVLGSDAGGNSVVLCEMFVDDLANLPAPDAYTGYKLSMGCTATVINDNSRHRINSAGQWVQIMPGNSTYTRAEIDSMIARIDATEAEDRAALIAQVDGGAKNLLKIEAIGADSTTYGTTVTKNGVEYTLQADGSIVINRVSSNANSSYIFFRKKDGTTAYITDYMDNAHYVSGVSGGSVGTYAIFISNYNGQGTSRYIGEPSLLTPSSVTPNACGISIGSGYSPVNLVIKPMICTAADYAISPAFVPYAPTNRELYDMIQSYHP